MINKLALKKRSSRISLDIEQLEDRYNSSRDAEKNK
jgi:hypothetical protein